VAIAQEVYEGTVQRAFPIGRGVCFKHGRYLRKATVIEYGYGDSLRVRSPLGARYWITAARILEDHSGGGGITRVR
jgi:hypothetical protein